MPSLPSTILRLRAAFEALPIALVLVPAPAAAQCASAGSGYTVVPLSGLENESFIANALNDAGQVAGTILPSLPTDPATVFVWQDGILTTHAFPGSVAAVTDLSESGLVVGTVRPTGSSDTDTFVWDSATDLVQIVTTPFEPQPQGINDARLVVGVDQDGTFGYAQDATTGQVSPIAFGDVPAVGVGTLGAAAVNDAGVVVGSEVVFDAQQGFFVELPWRWTAAGGIEELAGVPGGFGGRAVAVADDGRMAGYVLDAFFSRGSALWSSDGSAVTNLGAPPNYFVSDALGLNVHGQVVVVAPNDLFGYTRGFVWEDGAWTDLSCYAPPGLFVSRPVDVNDAGQILARLTDAAGLVIVDTVILEPQTPFVPAQEVVRAGTPPNPTVFLPGVTSGPVLGATWDPVIDHVPFLPGATLDVAGVTLDPTNLSLPPFGTLLCDVSSAPPFQFTSAPEVPFVIPIPSQASLAGLSMCAQGLSTDGSTVALTNALDITLGTY